MPYLVPVDSLWAASGLPMQLAQGHTEYYWNTLKAGDFYPTCRFSYNPLVL